MAVVKLVRDKETMESFGVEDDKKLQALLKEKLMKAGLFGHFRNPIMLLPSLIVTKDEIDYVLKALDKVIGEIEKEL